MASVLTAIVHHIDVRQLENNTIFLWMKIGASNSYLVEFLQGTNVYYSRIASDNGLAQNYSSSELVIVQFTDTPMSFLTSMN